MANKAALPNLVPTIPADFVRPGRGNQTSQPTPLPTRKGVSWVVFLFGRVGPVADGWRLLLRMLLRVFGIGRKCDTCSHVWPGSELCAPLYEHKQLPHGILKHILFR
jgi:hypothetical protein